MIKRIIKLCIAVAFRGFEIFQALRHKEEKPGSLVVLTYHAVLAEQLERFEKQLEKMVHSAIPVSTDAIRELKKGKHHVAVTFDDGYESTIDRVIPVLTKRGIPVTFFIPTAYFGREAEWISDGNRRSQVGHIVTSEKLFQISERPSVSVGSHGINHRRLTEMDENEASMEMLRSKERLEGITGRCLKSFGVPFGAYTGQHVTMARESGYEHMFTDDFTYVTGTTGISTKFVIGRTEVNPTDWPLEFELKMTGAYRWHNKAIDLKKRILKILRQR